MKVCGIVGSPKKNGNVDLLVSQVLKGTKSEGAETKMTGKRWQKPSTQE